MLIQGDIFIAFLQNVPRANPIPDSRVIIKIEMLLYFLTLLILHQFLVHYVTYYHKGDE